MSEKKAPLSTGRKLVYSLVVLLFFIVAVILVGEIVIRVCCKQKYTKQALYPPYDLSQKDDKLGWRIKPNYAFDGNMPDLERKEYPVSLRFDDNGFKAFGDTAAAKPKIFFLGDSYTASIEASNEHTFFNLIGDSLDAEIFAYGQAGYGTLQQYMMFDEWVDKIRPGAVVWQVCSNDFIDNEASLEIEAGYKVGERRPYLGENGEIYYRLPVNFWQSLQRNILFFKWLDERRKVFQQKFMGQEIRVAEYYVSNEKRAYPPYDRSVRNTERTVEMIKKRLPAGIKLIAFSADLYEPQLSEFRRIFESNGFAFYDTPARLVEQATHEQKLVTRSLDGYHWNHTGHELVARALVPVLREALGK
jgi:lysophospholipase L1-like esterase